VRVQDLPPLKRIVVAIDPNASSDEDSKECGIICAGLGADGHGYVLDDVSGVMAPHEWTTTAISLLHDRMGDRVIAETNNGGKTVEHTLRIVDRTVPFSAVWASRGKVTRAEPVEVDGEGPHLVFEARKRADFCSPNSPRITVNTRLMRRIRRLTSYGMPVTEGRRGILAELKNELWRSRRSSPWPLSAKRLGCFSDQCPQLSSGLSADVTFGPFMTLRGLLRKVSRLALAHAPAKWTPVRRQEHTPF
jgi:hypothetical protein